MYVIVNRELRQIVEEFEAREEAEGVWRVGSSPAIANTRLRFGGYSGDLLD